MHKVHLLASLLMKHPQEFTDRVINRLGRGSQTDLGKEHFVSAKLNDIIPWEQGLKVLEETFGEAVHQVLQEPALQEVETHISSEINSLSGVRATIPLDYNADFSLGRFCYLICRLTKPKVFIETGVAYGVKTCFILKALQQNKSGTLHSIDLPPLMPNVDRSMDCLIPQQLKSRWKFHRRSSRRFLPRLLRRVGKVDVFLHDSDHSYTNTYFELHTVTPALSVNAIAIADDVDSKAAWPIWIDEAQPQTSAIIHEADKDASFEFCVGDKYLPRYSVCA